MRYLLLDVWVDTVVPLIILVAGISIAVLVYLTLKKRTSIDAEFKGKKGSSTVEVVLNKTYCSNDEMKFLEYLHRALPKEFIAFPRVGVDNIVQPKKDRVAYNSIMSKYVDVCVFTRKNMEPVLVIDLVMQSTAQQQYKVIDQNVVAVLKAVKLNVVEIDIEPAYDLEKLREKVLNGMPAKTVSMIKENYIKDNSKG